MGRSKTKERETAAPAPVAIPLADIEQLEDKYTQLLQIAERHRDDINAPARYARGSGVRAQVYALVIADIRSLRHAQTS